MALDHRLSVPKNVRSSREDLHAERGGLGSQSPRLLRNQASQESLSPTRIYAKVPRKKDPRRQALSPMPSRNAQLDLFNTEQPVSPFEVRSPRGARTQMNSMEDINLKMSAAMGQMESGGGIDLP